MNKYIDALGEYAKDVIEQMFDSCTFDVWKRSYTSDVEVASDGATILRCCADWMVDIKTHDSSNSVDNVALLIKNAIERAIDGSEISVKYKILY